MILHSAWILPQEKAAAGPIRAGCPKARPPGGGSVGGRLEYPNFVGPVVFWIDHVHRAGDAGIEGVNGAENF